MDIQFFGGRGGKSNKKLQGELIRGVPQDEIDKLRGTRDHQFSTDINIKDDYARIGIKISNDEANKIFDAIHNFTDDNYFTDMRKAYSLEKSGRKKDLTSYDKDLLDRYKMCMEYTKIAPTFTRTGVDEIYRGIEDRGDLYFSKMNSLKVGDKWNVDNMPTSFSTKLLTAEEFAGGGIIIHMPIKGLKNSPSIQGMSIYSGEEEVLVGDYKWKVSNIVKNYEKHIYLEPDN